MIRRARVPEESAVTVRDRLVQAGLDAEYADLFLNMPHKVVHVEPRRPFREPGIARDEVMLVRSGILAKFKSDGSGRRQIVSLRFPGEGVLPHDSAAKHVQGAAAYIDDIPEPAGMLHVHLGMSQRAHARIVSMDLSAVRASPGVVAVLTAQDIPGENDVSPVVKVFHGFLLKNGKCVRPACRESRS